MKKTFVLFLLTLFLAGCSQLNTQAPEHESTFSTEARNHESTEARNHESTEAREHLSTSTVKESSDTVINNNETIEQFDNEATTSTEIAEEMKEVSTLLVGDKTYTLPFRENISVYEFMQDLSAMSSQQFYFETKEFSGLGQFVISINGKKQDTLKGKYWIYYINGESANVGISNYAINKGDIIEWKYGE